VPTFAGFETAAVLAEESQDPKRNIPRAILLATLGAGIFFVIGIYAGVVAWGPAKMAAYFSSSNAWQVLATSVWGKVGAILVFLALVNSILGNTNAAATAATRLMYAMGRIAALPRWFGRVNQSTHTPANAIFFLMGMSIVVAVVASLALGGPTQGFGFVITLGALFFILLYMLACVAVPFLYLRHLRSEFNPVKHLIIPAVGILIFILPLVSTVYPVPPSPLNVVPYIDLGWLVLGLIVMYLLLRTRPESVLRTEDIMLDAYEGGEEMSVAVAPGVAMEEDQTR
jgi:amino acid transporter